MRDDMEVAVEAALMADNSSAPVRYAPLVEPICETLDVCATFNANYVASGKGPAALAHLLRTMARNLDTAIDRLKAAGLPT